MNRPDHPDYDSSSVYISDEDFKKLSPMMKQYWSYKRNYYDSVVAMRFGRWYFVFTNDLLALNKVSETPLNLSYIFHGFHEIDKDKYIGKYYLLSSYLYSSFKFIFCRSICQAWLQSGINWTDWDYTHDAE